MNLKEYIKNILFHLHIDLTKNQEYDRYTHLIMKKVIRRDSNCIDIGCHKGEILQKMIAFAPEGKHYAFEPIPKLFEALNQKYKNCNVDFFDVALCENKGTDIFNYVQNAPAYSGLKKRRYAISEPDIKELSVKTDLLDNVLPAGQPIQLIKIDVEGGEFSVLKGAKSTIIKNKPFIIFECGLGGSDYYGTKPAAIFDFITVDCGMKISTLKNWYKQKNNCSQEQFCELFNSNKEYYFIAHC